MSNSWLEDIGEGDDSDSDYVRICSTIPMSSNDGLQSLADDFEITKTRIVMAILCYAARNQEDMRETLTSDSDSTLEYSEEKQIEEVLLNIRSEIEEYIESDS